MPNYAIVNPYPVFLNQIGGGLNAGKVYIGVAGQDPETNPLPVFWDAEGAIPAIQPIRTIGGYLARMGTPAGIYAGAEYSIRVRDRFDNQVYYNPSVSGGIGTFITDLAGIDGAALVGFSQDSDDAAARTMLDKAREILSPADFGVTADGVDSSAAWQKLVNYVNDTDKCPSGALIHLPAGRIALSASSTFTNHVTFFGQGSGVTSIELSANARISFTGQRRHGGGDRNTQFSLYGTSFLTANIHTSSPLFVSYAAFTGEGGVSPTLTMTDCNVSGSTNANGFKNGLELVDVPWPKLTNVSFRGNDSKTAEKAIKYTGAHGSGSFDKVRAYYVDDGIYCEGEMEGLQFSDCEMVAVMRGITGKDTSNGLQPFCVIDRCHINAEESGIVLSGITQFRIGLGTLLYAQGYKGTTSTAYAIDITPSTVTGGPDTIVASGSISGVDIYLGGAYAANAVGIRVRGSATTLEDYTIVDTHIEQGLIGIQLDVNTNGVAISDTVTFRNCVTDILDDGTKNHRQPQVVSASVVGNTNGPGQIAFTFPAGAAFRQPPVVTVAGGDGGFNSFTVISGSVTALGFIVQVGTNGVAAAAGTPYRVNYVAAGN